MCMIFRKGARTNLKHNKRPLYKEVENNGGGGYGIISEQVSYHYLSDR